jgi:hypothetical protein
VGKKIGRRETATGHSVLLDCFIDALSQFCVRILRYKRPRPSKSLHDPFGPRNTHVHDLCRRG